MMVHGIQRGKVTAVEERKEPKHISGAGKEAVMSERSLGWFVTIDGLYTFPFDRKPELKVGMTVNLIIEECK